MKTKFNDLKDACCLSSQLWLEANREKGLRWMVREVLINPPEWVTARGGANVVVPIDHLAICYPEFQKAQGSDRQGVLWA